eukprot:c8173_g1_i1.p1 GENE.c8173_g1_i1~~c8173_g1_i1.p1  ORF type:complete len:168 (-),score=40.43 c8173_g1_i1:38-541(-)
MLLSTNGRRFLFCVSRTTRAALSQKYLLNTNNSLYISPTHFVMNSSFSSTASAFETSGDYETFVERVLLRFEEDFEELSDKVDIDDLSLSHGVLTFTLSNKTYVINQHTASKQIWLSSPFSGPKHFSYDIKSNEWVDTKGGLNLHELLGKELSEYFKTKIEFHGPHK